MRSKLSMRSPLGTGAWVWRLSIGLMPPSWGDKRMTIHKPKKTAIMSPVKSMFLCHEGLYKPVKQALDPVKGVYRLLRE